MFNWDQYILNFNILDIDEFSTDNLLREHYKNLLCIYRDFLTTIQEIDCKYLIKPTVEIIIIIIII